MSGRSGEAIEDESFGFRVFVHLGFQHADGHIVRHQLALIHVGLRELAQFGAAFDVGPKDVAGAQVNQSVLLDQVGALGAFAGSGRSKKDDVQHLTLFQLSAKMRVQR